MCNQSGMIMLEPVKEVIQTVVLRILAVIPRAHHLSFKKVSWLITLVICKLQTENNI